jgi:hypothetical protein
MAYGALLCIYLQPHAAGQELADRGHDAHTGTRAANEHVTVVGMSHEPMAPPRQLLIQLVENDAGQER